MTAKMSKSYEDQLIREVNENVLKRFGRFVDHFNHELATIHNLNVKQIKSSIEVPFDCPSIDCNDVKERTDLIELLQTCGNMQLNKVVLVFGRLTQEMQYLAQTGSQRFCDQLVLYGEPITSDINNEDMSSIAKLLPLLHDLSSFVNHCLNVVSNVVQQINGLINISNIPTKKGLSNNYKELIPDLSSNLRFDAVFDAICELGVTLINLDDIITNQMNLKLDFVNYKRIIELVSANSDKFDVKNDIMKVKTLFKLIDKIEKQLIDGDGIFKTFIDAMANDESIAKNSQMAEQFANYIRFNCSDMEVSPELILDNKFLGLNAFFVIYVWIFKKEDKRLYKMLTDCQKKIGINLCHLRGNCCVIPDKFVANHLPRSMFDKKLLETFNSQRELFLKQNFDREVKQINLKVTNWLVRFEQDISGTTDLNTNLIEVLTKQQKVIEEGLENVRILTNLIKNCISLHLQNGRPMAKQDLLAICKAICIVKGIQLTFYHKKGHLINILGHLAQYICCVILKMLSNVKTRLMADVKKYSEKKLDLLSAVILTSNCLNGPILTEQRRILISICLAFISFTLSAEELTKILTLTKKLELFTKVHSLMNQWSNCDFLYFNRAVLGVYFIDFFENDSSNVNELRHFFNALTDSLTLINKCIDEEKRQILLKQFDCEINEIFVNEFLDKICTEFETELRLQIHSDLQLDDQNPFKRNLYDFSALFAAEPIYFNNKLLSIKNYVEEYLNEMAYNLTTIALHDWKTYESMLNLAKTKYGFEFVRSQLPTQTLEQGLDVLEITRNIHVFVSRYLYNLNNQMFIEKSSNNKHLNVLLIRHVANSIQTHGFGIINTTVNFTYLFLRKKFYTFSQFLYEEHIKSRLIKDLRHFRESNAIKFAFEKADKLVKGIRKLGLTPDGFVRMLRSGALHCSSNSVNFVPDLDDLTEVSFHAMTSEENLSADTVTAAHNLDSILVTLNRNFTESTDYFKLLVDVFVQIIRDPKNYHLKNFYVILPALTYNFVENLIISKEKMTRKNKVGAAFTDDGFAMGVAYILKLLNQFNDFDSLHWFSSVSDKIKAEINEANKQNQINANSDVKLTQTTSLTIKRLENLQKEFDLLEYSLTSSRILFKATPESVN
ncbi:WASH complex subunit 4-like [Oppia nitens]|uniref:WASH complex subunit 4-like n=1 Tax=Oppia nitens TaxID=1686743 RepID=UPI0023DB556E|nr:WASH complex subunit 4-like [Oppia nitens]